MSDLDNNSRLLVEGMKLVVEQRVNKLIKDITSDIIANKLTELEGELSLEIQTLFEKNYNQGANLLKVMVDIKTNKGNSK